MIASWELANNTAGGQGNKFLVFFFGEDGLHTALLAVGHTPKP